MEQVVLTAYPRDGRGKEIARKLRAQGLIPVVLYGGKDKNSNLSLSINYKDALKILKSEMGMGTISQLDLEGVEEKRVRNVIFRDVQLHPVKHNILHIDLYEVSMDKSLQVEVPIELTGQPVGVKEQGGILEHSLRSLNIECLPGQIPGHIEVDVSELNLGKSIHVAELQLPEGVKTLDNPEQVVVSVVEPAKIEEVTVEEAVEGEAAEAAEEGAAEKSAAEESK